MAINHTCTKCKKEKNISYFIIKKDTGRPRSWCKDCRNAYSREKYKNPEVKLLYRKRLLKYEYGITLETFNKMFQDQNGQCATCERHQNELSKTLVVDHSHKTGKVRGLLCDYCNRLLGNYENKPQLFTRFDAYLKDAA